MLGNINSDWVHADNPEEQSPFAAFFDVDDIIEQSEQNHGDSSDYAREWTAPKVFVDREYKIPKDADDNQPCTTSQQTVHFAHFT